MDSRRSNPSVKPGQKNPIDSNTIRSSSLRDYTPRPRIEAIRIVDMSSSNSWAEFAALFRNTREAFLDHERAKSELKALMPEDAKEAIGHGVRAKRSKAGAVSFDALTTEAAHAPVQ